MSNIIYIKLLKYYGGIILKVNGTFYYYPYDDPISVEEQNFSIYLEIIN